MFYVYDLWVHCSNNMSEEDLQELAEESGVSLDMLEQLEQNILPEEMMVDDACRLAKALHCKIHELFD